MIVLIHDYVVTLSQYSYILMRDKHKQDKNGKPIYETVGYYGTLESAIIAAKDHCFKERISGDVVCLAQAIDTLKQVSDEFSELIKRSIKND